MWLRGLITACCLGLAAGHIFYPTVTVDTVTVILLLVAVLPWLSSVIKTLELPGGFKIELQDVKAATDKVLAAPARIIEASGEARVTSSGNATAVVRTGIEETTAMVQEISGKDPNLVVIAVGIEIEKRLREIAKNRGIDAGRMSLIQLLSVLKIKGILSAEVISGLRDLAALRNQAAHGSAVAPEAAAWALDELPSILTVLDEVVKGSGE